MVSKSALLSDILLVSVVLASPFTRHGTRIAPRHQSEPVNHIELRADDLRSTSWAGAIWIGGLAGTFASVKGTFTVPTPSGSKGSTVSVWVGIDGHTCANAVFQTGIQATVSDDGQASYAAWHQWFPDGNFQYHPMTVSAGHIITATIIAHTSTTGTAIIENSTTGQTVTRNVSSSHSLCLQDAEWIVEDPTLHSTGKLMPLANFGTVTFTDAAASGSGGSRYTPTSGARVTNIEQDGTVRSSVSIGTDGVIVRYV